MMRDQRPPFLNSQTLKVLVKPAGPHHRTRRAGSRMAAKTSSTVAGISRDVLNVLIGFLVLAFMIKFGILTGSKQASVFPPSSPMQLSRIIHIYPETS